MKLGIKPYLENNSTSTLLLTFLKPFFNLPLWKTVFVESNL
ncbi:hypothetical protein PROCH_1505 [Prochlorococcus marinus str. EQPAC1]|nr:hypothetical protein PROCH_1505 [Prochlorococcus marinus str. EQPAC1]